MIYKGLLLILFVISFSMMPGVCQQVSPKREIVREGKKLIVYDNNFEHRVLTHDFLYQKLRKAYSKNSLSRKAVSTPHVKGQINYYLSFTNGKDNFKFYDNREKIFPVSINLYTPEVALEKDLKVGMEKRHFSEKYKLNNVPDTVQFSEVEQGSLFTFIFRNNVLSSINFTISYLD